MGRELEEISAPVLSPPAMAVASTVGAPTPTEALSTHRAWGLQLHLLTWKTGWISWVRKQAQPRQAGRLLKEKQFLTPPVCFQGTLSFQTWGTLGRRAVLPVGREQAPCIWREWAHCEARLRRVL